MKWDQLVSVAAVVNPKTGLAAGLGASVSVAITSMYGAGEGRYEIGVALIALVIMDWITGIAASRKDKTYSSDYGLSGIMRTLFILAFPCLATLLDDALGTPGFLFFGVAFGILYHTWQSMTANAYRAGWEKWIPEAIFKMVESEIQAKANRAAKRKEEDQP